MLNSNYNLSVQPCIFYLSSKWTIIIFQKVCGFFYIRINSALLKLRILGNGIVVLKWLQTNHFFYLSVNNNSYDWLIHEFIRSLQDIASKPININFVNILCLCVMSLEDQSYLFYLLGSKALKCSLLTHKICNIFLTTAILFTNR